MEIYRASDATSEKLAGIPESGMGFQARTQKRIFIAFDPAVIMPLDELRHSREATELESSFLGDVDIREQQAQSSKSRAANGGVPILWL